MNKESDYGFAVASGGGPRESGAALPVHGVDGRGVEGELGAEISTCEAKDDLVQRGKLADFEILCSVEVGAEGSCDV